MSAASYCLKPDTIPLPKCRMIRDDSRRAAFNCFPSQRREMVMVKLHTFGFLAVVLVGLLFSSCAAARRALASAAWLPPAEPN